MANGFEIRFAPGVAVIESGVEGKLAGVATQLTYMAALDGLRAVSISGVLINNGGTYLAPKVLPELAAIGRAPR